MRARLFAQRGLIELIEPAQLDAPVLAGALGRALRGEVPGGSRNAPGLDGVERATDSLLEELELPRASRAVAPAGRTGSGATSPA
jgi:hypothetical protein